MSLSNYTDDLGSAVHYALETTHAIAVCPFHLDLTIRVGDDAAESHARARAKKLVKSDGTTWEGEALRKEFGRQLGKAADRYATRSYRLRAFRLNQPRRCGGRIADVGHWRHFPQRIIVNSWPPSALRTAAAR